MQDLDKFKNEMNLSGKNVYVGHRYVPKLDGEWDNTKIYEPLTIVTYQGNSFTSRQYVPIGAEITNEEFWVSIGNYNAQIEQYRQDVRNLETDITNNFNTFKDETNTTLTDMSDNLLNITNQYFVTVSEMGAVGDGVTDDTTAIRSAIDLVSLNGGVLVFEKNKEYLVSSDLYFKNTNYVTVEGNNSTLIRKETTTQYSVVYYSGDITFNNLHIVGHIHWASETATFPVQGFGYRSMKTSGGKTIFNNCKVRNISFEGFYHDAEKGSVEMNNCQSYDCYRCAVAFVGGAYLKIDGGVYGANTLENITKSVSAIAVEPSKSANIQHVEIINCEVPNHLSIYDGETNKTTIQYVYLDNITFDDTTPNVRYGLTVMASLKTVIGRMIFNGTSGYLSLNTPPNTTFTKGYVIDFLKEEKKSSNLVNKNSFVLGGTASAVSEVVFNDVEGYHFNNTTSGGYANYTQTIPLYKNAWYTLSALMEIITLAGAGSGVVLTVGDRVITLQGDRNRRTSYANMAFYSGEEETATLMIGTWATNAINTKIGDVRLHVGFVNI